MRVLLDTNVILDAMLQRAPWHAEADAILNAASDGHITCVTTPLALANVFYVGRRTLGTDAARQGVRLYLKALEILPIDQQTIHDADVLPGTDLEDNIQSRPRFEARSTRSPHGIRADSPTARSPC